MPEKANRVLENRRFSIYTQDKRWIHNKLLGDMCTKCVADLTKKKLTRILRTADSNIRKVDAIIKLLINIQIVYENITDVGRLAYNWYLLNR